MRPTQCPCAAFWWRGLLKANKLGMFGRGRQAVQNLYIHIATSRGQQRAPSAKPGRDREPQLQHTAIVRYSVLKRPNIETYEYGIENLMISADYPAGIISGLTTPENPGSQVRTSVLHPLVLKPSIVVFYPPAAFFAFFPFHLSCNAPRYATENTLKYAALPHPQQIHTTVYAAPLYSIQLPCPLLAQPRTTISGSKSLAMQKHQITTPYIFQRTP